MIAKDMPESFIALCTVPVALKNGAKSVCVNALLDDGSTKTYLNSDVAAELGLVGQSERITVSVLNGQYEVFDTMPVEVTLQSVDGAVSQRIVALTTDRVTGNPKAIEGSITASGHICMVSSFQNLVHATPSISPRNRRR